MLTLLQILGGSAASCTLDIAHPLLQLLRPRKTAVALALPDERLTHANLEIAARAAFKEGMTKAGAILLEPIMKVEVVTPEDYMGNVMGDLSSRRGIVQGMEDLPGGTKEVRAEVPLSEMFGYATSLRSLSQGRATYTMEFKHYVEAPKNVAEAVINKK